MEEDGSACCRDSFGVVREILYDESICDTFGQFVISCWSICDHLLVNLWPFADGKIGKNLLVINGDQLDKIL